MHIGAEILQGLRPWPAWLPRPTPSRRELEAAACERAAAKAARRRARCEAFLRQRFGLTRPPAVQSHLVGASGARRGALPNERQRAAQDLPALPDPDAGSWLLAKQGRAEADTDVPEAAAAALAVSSETNAEPS